MKLYISYALASLLVAAPLTATDDADKAAQVKKSTQQDDEANSAPVAKKIAQTLWKHKGKVALGTSILILAALAYLYKDSLYALFVAESHSENTTNLQQPSVEKNILDIATDDKIRAVALADTIVAPVKAIVVETSDKGIVVLPVSQALETVLEPKPVTPPTVPEVTPSVTMQEPAQVTDIIPDVPIATDTNAELINSNNPQNF
jgi:hypothetical protein